MPYNLVFNTKKNNKKEGDKKMLVIKKVLDFNDFDYLFNYEMDYMNDEARRIIYDYLVNMDEELEEENISDFIRYDINVMSVDDIISDYNYMMDEEEFQQLEDDEIPEYVENFLNDYTTVLGTYEEEGETFIVFTEF